MIPGVTASAVVLEEAPYISPVTLLDGDVRKAASNITTHTFSVDVEGNSGDDRLLVATIAHERSPMRNISSFTLNGVAGTLLGSPTLQHLRTYYWLDDDLPATAGTYNHELTWNANNRTWMYGNATFSGVDQLTAPEVAIVENSSAPVTSLSVSDTTDPDWLSVIAWMIDDAELPTRTGEQTPLIVTGKQ